MIDKRVSLLGGRGSGWADDDGVDGSDACWRLLVGKSCSEEEVEECHVLGGLGMGLGFE